MDEKWAKAAFEANAANGRPFADEAEEVDAEASAKDAPDGSDGDGGDGGDGGDVKEDSLMESQVRHHRGHHRKHAGRWRSWCSIDNVKCKSGRKKSQRVRALRKACFFIFFPESS